MAVTFKNLQDRINLDYLNRTDFTNETKRAIVRAIKHYERARLWFNQTATAINVSTAATTLAVPADFIALDMMTITQNGANPTQVTQRAYERVTYRNASGTSGVPEEVAVYRNLFNFYPKPSSAFPVTVSYVFRLPELSADSDTNDWLAECEDVICFHATADMLQNVVRRPMDEVQQMQQMEATALGNLNLARKMHMNTDEDIGILGPIHRQDTAKTDGSTMADKK